MDSQASPARIREHATLPLPDEQPIQPRLSGTGSLRAELEALLAVATPETTQAELRRLVVEDNVTGKRSETTRKITWKYLRPRYALDPAIPEYRAFVAGMRVATAPTERGLLCGLMFARCDRLLREVTIECVSPLLREPGTVIEPSAIDGAIRQHTVATGQSWSPSVQRGVVSHLQSSLKDFGLLTGSLKRRTVRPRVGVQGTLLALRLGRLEGLTDRQALGSRWFRFLGLEREAAMELCYTAARAGAVGFRAQADVVEIRLPAVE